MKNNLIKVLVPLCIISIAPSVVQSRETSQKASPVQKNTYKIGAGYQQSQQSPQNKLLKQLDLKNDIKKSLPMYKIKGFANSEMSVGQNKFHAKPLDQQDANADCLKIAADCSADIVNTDGTFDITESKINECAADQDQKCSGFELCGGKEQVFSDIWLENNLKTGQKAKWQIECDKKGGSFNVLIRCKKQNYSHAEEITYSDNVIPTVYGCVDNEWWGVNLASNLILEYSLGAPGNLEGTQPAISPQKSCGFNSSGVTYFTDGAGTSKDFGDGENGMLLDDFYEAATLTNDNKKLFKGVYPTIYVNKLMQKSSTTCTADLTLDVKNKEEIDAAVDKFCSGDDPIVQCANYLMQKKGQYEISESEVSDCIVNGLPECGKFSFSVCGGKEHKLDSDWGIFFTKNNQIVYMDVFCEKKGNGFNVVGKCAEKTNSVDIKFNNSDMLAKAMICDGKKFKELDLSASLALEKSGNSYSCCFNGLDEKQCASPSDKSVSFINIEKQTLTEPVPSTELEISSLYCSEMNGKDCTTCSAYLKK